MREDGFLFPENQETVPPGSDMKKIEVEKPDLSFLNGKNTSFGSPNPPHEYQANTTRNESFTIGDIQGLPKWSQIQYPDLYPH